jgi:hypothetical protein
LPESLYPSMHSCDPLMCLRNHSELKSFLSVFGASDKSPSRSKRGTTCRSSSTSASFCSRTTERTSLADMAMLMT